MDIKILPASEVRDRMASVLKQIRREDIPCFVTQYGHAEAVLMSIEHYKELMSLIEDIEDQQDRNLIARVNKARAEYKRTGGVSLRSVIQKEKDTRR